MTDSMLVPPEQRDLTFTGSLLVICVERHQASYSINGRLHRTLQVCPNCGHTPLSATGFYKFTVTDIPFQDATKRVMPVRYIIDAQRFVCRACKKICVEPRPSVLNSVVTRALLTRRMSEWLIAQLQTTMPYSTLAITAGYSTVWLRKWYAEVRRHMDLPPKKGRNGPKKIDRSPEFALAMQGIADIGFEPPRVNIETRPVDFS